MLIDIVLNTIGILFFSAIAIFILSSIHYSNFLKYLNSDKFPGCSFKPKFKIISICKEDKIQFNISVRFFLFTYYLGSYKENYEEYFVRFTFDSIKQCETYINRFYLCKIQLNKIKEQEKQETLDTVHNKVIKVIE